MGSVIKFAYFLSMVFGLGNLFFAYYQFPDFVPISYSENLGLKEYMSKTNLFYAGAISIFAANLLLSILKKLVEFIPYSYLPIPAKKFWLSSHENREALVRIHQEWLNGWGVWINFLIGYVFLCLFFINVAEFGSFASFAPLVYILIGIISLWWIVLLVRVSKQSIRL
jgi:hypothetical protein